MHRCTRRNCRINLQYSFDSVEASYGCQMGAYGGEVEDRKEHRSHIQCFTYTVINHTDLQANVHYIHPIIIKTENLNGRQCNKRSHPNLNKRKMHKSSKSVDIVTRSQAKWRLGFESTRRLSLRFSYNLYAT